jgi:septum formation protein
MSERPATLVLASASPQRRAILARLGVEFEVRPSGAAELQAGEPERVALENALRKARAVRDRTTTEQGGGSDSREELVLGVDTLVALDGRVYGKPPDEDEARETLRALAGRTHTVIGGLALLGRGTERTGVARTAVSFRDLDAAQLEWYLATGEWRGRAGGYAIQGAGAALVRGLEGDYENVVGLPLALLLELHPGLLGG